MEAIPIRFQPNCQLHVKAWARESSGNWVDKSAGSTEARTQPLKTWSKFTLQALPKKNDVWRLQWPLLEGNRLVEVVVVVAKNIEGKL